MMETKAGRGGQWQKRDAVVVFLGVVLWLLGLLGLGAWWNRLPPRLPWFYSMPWGEGRLVTKMELLLIWSGIGGVAGVNVWLAVWWGKGERLLQRIWLWGGVAVMLLAWLGLMRMLMIII